MLKVVRNGLLQVIWGIVIANLNIIIANRDFIIANPNIIIANQGSSRYFTMSLTCLAL